MAEDEPNGSGTIPQAMSEEIRDLVKSSVQEIIPGLIANLRRNPVGGSATAEGATRGGTDGKRIH